LYLFDLASIKNELRECFFQIWYLIDVWYIIHIATMIISKYVIDITHHDMTKNNEYKKFILKFNLIFLKMYKNCLFWVIIKIMANYGNILMSIDIYIKKIM